MKAHKQDKRQQRQIREAQEQEARLQLDRERGADCRAMQDKLGKDFATFVKIISSLAAAGIAGTSTALTAGTCNRTFAAWALGLLGFSLACIVMELLVAMKSTEEYAGRLAVDETGQPGLPRWTRLIDWLLNFAAIGFIAGMICLCCSWFFL